jgi:hypothetical protein
MVPGRVEFAIQKKGRESFAASKGKGTKNVKN